MLTSEGVARHILFMASRGDEPVPLTHMQLQKLAYYAQGWSLALRDVPLFASRIEAWPHGPVVKDIFRIFTGYRARPIDPTEAREAQGANDADLRLLDSIWRGYGRYSASYLRELTHAEAPWLDARVALPDEAASDAEITHDSMRSYFRARDAEACARLGISRAELDLAITEARTGRCIPWDTFKQGLSRAVAD